MKFILQNDSVEPLEDIGPAIAATQHYFKIQYGQYFISHFKPEDGRRTLMHIQEFIPAATIKKKMAFMQATYSLLAR